MNLDEFAAVLNRNTALLEGLLALAPQIRQRMAERRALAEQQALNRRALAFEPDPETVRVLVLRRQAAENTALSRMLADEYADRAGAVVLADPPKAPAADDVAAQARHLAEKYLPRGMKLADAR